LFSWLALERKPLLSIYGYFNYLRFFKRSLRYWDPSHYFSIVPGAYLEVDILKWWAYFIDFRIGYGNEDGNSTIELGGESGFIFRLAHFSTLRVEGFYGQTGRDLGTRGYYFYGAKALLSFGF